MEVTSILERYGVAVVVLFWFMFRMEKRLDKLMDGFQDMLTILKIMTKTTPPALAVEEVKEDAE